MDENTKFLKAKEKFTQEIQSLIETEDIVNEYIRRNRSFEKYYPEFKAFNQYLDTLHSKLHKKKKEKAIKNYEYEIEKRKHSDKDGYISNYYVPQFLGISDKIFKKMVEKNIVKPAGYLEFRKWGKKLQTPYFDYDLLYKIKHEKLEEYINKVNGFKNNKQFNDWSSIAEEITSKYDLIYKHNAFYRTINMEMINRTILEKIDLGINKDNFEKLDIKDIQIDFENKIKKQSKNDVKIKEKFESIVEINNLDNEEIRLLSNIRDSVSQTTFFNLLSEIINEIHLDRKMKHLETVLDLKNYQNSFKVARNMKRKINFYIGPTNSGKTYQALESLMKAETGIYLAPLRLMALEAFEKLNATGIPCNLITGEEHIIIKDAKHTSSTIECLDINEEFDCAVIDEIQMISDRDRGWAWTKALLGVAAKEVNVVGSEQPLDLAVKILKNVGEECNVFHKERMSSLKIMPQKISIQHLQSGDALIAFSKRQVLKYAADLKDAGKKVSIIYGALSPEVRRKQANLFASGHNHILVSTDAIGMGLNLPINRVVFSSLEKYDGIENRVLNSTEIKQIAGRAGRANKEGLVTTLSEYKKYNNNILVKGFVKEDPSLVKFPIMPNTWHVSKIKEVFGTESILHILKVFPDLCNTNDYYSSIKDDILTLAEIVDRKLPRSAEEKLKFCLAPVDIKSETQMNLFYRIVKGVFVNGKEFVYDRYTKLKENGTYKDLEVAEEELKCITLFCYFAKFSDKIILDGVTERKQNLEEFIFKTLLTVEVPDAYDRWNRDYYGYGYNEYDDDYDDDDDY